MSDLESVELNESSSGAPVRFHAPTPPHPHPPLTSHSPALQREAAAAKKPVGSHGRLILGNGAPSSHTLTTTCKVQTTAPRSERIACSVAACASSSVRSRPQARPVRGVYGIYPVSKAPPPSCPPPPTLPYYFHQHFAGSPSSARMRRRALSATASCLPCAPPPPFPPPTFFPTFFPTSSSFSSSHLLSHLLLLCTFYCAAEFCLYLGSHLHDCRR